MNEAQFQQELQRIYNSYPDQVTNLEGGFDVWAKMQYDNAFGLMNGMWNPAMAEQLLANLEISLKQSQEETL